MSNMFIIILVISVTVVLLAIVGIENSPYNPDWEENESL